jgi:Protein of unknown function (DUF3106)
MRKNERMPLTHCRLRHLTLATSLVGVAFVVSAQVPEAASAPAADAASAVSVALPPPIPAPAPITTTPVPKVSPLAPTPTWAELNPAQRNLLTQLDLESEWDRLPTERRRKWLTIANRFPALPAEQQLRIQERLRAWVKLDVQERQRARAAFQAAIQLDAEGRLSKWEAYQALPAEKRSELADKAAKKQARAAVTPAPSPKPALLGAVPKSNVVPAPARVTAALAVAPTLFQAKPGASTVLMTRPVAPPTHQSVGQFKLIADPALVDPKTLLPKSLQAPGSVQKK